MDEPIFKLPNGQYVCGAHHRVVCDYCYLDFSDMGDGVDRSDNHSGVGLEWIPIGPGTIKGIGRIFPTVFTPPTAQADPAKLFVPTKNQGSIPSSRLINVTNEQQALIYTDGACLNNGQPNARAGWAFVFGPMAPFSLRLENKGPFGEHLQPQTSNRAELRAVTGALRFRHWVDEGFTSLVIATDSEYVVSGATKWSREWVKNEWRTAAGDAVKNKDLWEMLLGEVERWDEEELEVVFWRIGREHNKIADAAAKKAAEEGADEAEFMDVMGAVGYL